MLSETVKNRLYNWKFDQAHLAVNTEEATEEEFNLILTLSMLFSDCGWFTGQMAELVQIAVTSLIGKNYGNEVVNEY